MLSSPEIEKVTSTKDTQQIWEELLEDERR